MVSARHPGDLARIAATSPGATLGVSGFELVDGTVTARMPARRLLPGADGRPAVGALGVLTDEVLGHAIMTGLPSGSWSISTEIWIDVVGPLPSGDEQLVATGRAVQVGSLAVGEVVTGSGPTVVLARQRGRAATPPAEVPTAPRGRDAGTLPALLNLHATEHGQTLRVSELEANPRGALHGGMSLAACEAAATAARVAAGSLLPTSSVHIVHTRPIPVGAVVELQTRTVHAGRTLWVGDVLAVVDGKVGAVARVTAQTDGAAAGRPGA